MEERYPRAADRARGDPRLPPRAGVPLPRRARARSTSARARSRAARPRAPRVGRPARGARARGRRRRSGCSRAPARCFPSGDPSALELLPLIGESLEGTANHAKAGEVYAEALEAARCDRRPARRGRARLGRAHVWFVADPEISGDEIVAEAERAIALLEEAGDERGWPRRGGSSGEARMYEGRAADGQRGARAGARACSTRTPRRGAGTRSRSRSGCACSTARRRSSGRPRSRRSGWSSPAPRACARSRPTCSTCSGSARRGAGDFDDGRAALGARPRSARSSGCATWRSGPAQPRAARARGRRPAAAERALRSSYEVLDEMGLQGLARRDRGAARRCALSSRAATRRRTRCSRRVKDEWASGDASIEAPRLCACARSCSRRRAGTSTRARGPSGRCGWCGGRLACLQADTLLAHAEVLRAHRP